MKVVCLEKVLLGRTFMQRYGLQVEACFVNDWGKLSWDVEKNM